MCSYAALCKIWCDGFIITSTALCFLYVYQYIDTVCLVTWFVIEQQPICHRVGDTIKPCKPCVICQNSNCHRLLWIQHVKNFIAFGLEFNYLYQNLISLMLVMIQLWHVHDQDCLVPVKSVNMKIACVRKMSLCAELCNLNFSTSVVCIFWRIYGEMLGSWSKFVPSCLVLFEFSRTKNRSFICGKICFYHF